MNEQLRAIQTLIEWIDEHAVENPRLIDMAREIGYSPYYCSEQFHRACGMTIKEYMAKRRLTMAATMLRDTDTPIIDVALECGFSSQSAFTRAFKEAYGCAPSAYRKSPTPIPWQIRKIVDPFYHIAKGDCDMSNIVMPNARVEYIPAHKYLGVYKESETANGKIWPGHDCDLLCGMVTSFTDVHPIVTGHTAGWSWQDGEKQYFYGMGVDADYSGAIPEGFELREIPDSYYLVFYHPPFVYPTENAEVMKLVEDLAWNFDPTTMGYEWNEDVCQDYQRHYPEGLGYQVLRPVKKMK